MKRFTVSLDEETYDRLLVEAAERRPPATLQQMIRHAVDRSLAGQLDDDDPIDEGTDVALAEVPEDVAPRWEAGSSDLSTFRIGNIWFGLPVALVEGIAARSTVEQLPSGRHDVLGAIRYRDGLIAVIDGATRLGTTSLSADSGQHLVIRQSDGLVALAVEEVGGLIPIGTGVWHPPPGGTNLTALDISAVVDSGDRLVCVLDGLAL